MTQENDPQNELEYRSLTFWERLRTQVFLFFIGLYRRMTVGVRAVLLRGSDQNQQVFLIKHTYLPGWQFPGGGVEPGETMFEAMAREAEEETGLRVSHRVQFLGVYLNAGASKRDHVGVFVCYEPQRVSEFKTDFEIADGQWFDLNALPEDITRGTRLRLQEITQGLPPAQRW